MSSNPMTGVFIEKGNLDTDMLIEDDMKTQGEDGHLQAKERFLDRSFPHSSQKETTPP